MTTDYFREKVAPTLPDQPGVYRFIGKGESVLYVGKAKSLRKRLGSYFNKEQFISGRVAVLTRNTKELLFTVVQTEHDALLLENSLIKRHQPRYNIQLKDDKSFPYICVKNEPFPRIFLTRRRLNDGSRYLGPFTSVKRMKHVLAFLRGLYPLRNCNLNLSAANIAKGKYRVCLEYHLGNCLGPCEGKQTEAEYGQSVDQIIDILKGRTSVVISSLNQAMKQHAGSLEFEKANVAKNRIDMLQDFQSSSAVVSPRIDNVDVFGIYRTARTSYVNYFRIANGTIILAHVAELRQKLDESDAEVLAFAVYEMREKFGSMSPEIIVPIRIDYPEPSTRITVPIRGEKKLLVDLCTRNAREYATMIEAQKAEKRNAKSSPVLEALKKDLRLPEIPTRIECIDNSNIHGSNPVSALVVFVNGKPAKEHYRHYNIKTVVGANDFATMEEIVQRRFSHAADEGQPMPQLLLIDGGKGQLNAARKALELLGLENRLTVAGIAKRLEEVYLANDPLPLHISKRSASLRLIQHIRDEAHRFAVSFHRLKRDKEMLQTELTDIPGIGGKTATALLKKFGSVKRVAEATEGELTEHVGSAKGKIVFSYFAASPTK